LARVSFNHGTNLRDNFQPRKENGDNFHHMSDILLRIQEISKNEGINITSFEKKIGASKGVLSRAIKQGTDIQTKWLKAIVENFPQYSADWLLTGEGKMIKEESSIPVTHHTDNPNEGIPLIPISAMAGAFTTESQVLECDCERYVVPVFKGADYLIGVKGVSMHPRFSPGDIVACKRLPMTDLFFQWNKVYVLDTDQGPLIKRLKPGSDKEHVLVVSDNHEYDPFELSINKIYHIALVIGVIRLE
jgi:phage repressor protein C with HTH and peptisase S24 domain